MPCLVFASILFSSTALTADLSVLLGRPSPTPPACTVPTYLRTYLPTAPSVSVPTDADFIYLLSIRPFIHPFTHSLNDIYDEASPSSPTCHATPSPFHATLCHKVRISRRNQSTIRKPVVL